MYPYIPIYIYIYIYIVCDKSCNGCRGKGNENCMACNSEYYPLDGQPSTCIFLCESEANSPLFLDLESLTCKLCHPNCLSCLGDSNITCTKCAPNYYLGNNRECIYNDCAQYTNTFASSEYICEDCNPTCDGCVELPNKCINCASQYFMFQETNTCTKKCPINYYANQLTKICDCKYIYIYNISYSMPSALPRM